MCMGNNQNEDWILKIKYDALCKRMSAKKALIAIARKLLVIIWNMLSKKEQYREYKVKPDKVKLNKRIVKLEKELAELKTA